MDDPDDSSGGHGDSTRWPIIIGLASAVAGTHRAACLCPGRRVWITLCPHIMSSSEWRISASGRRAPVHEASWHTCQLVSCYRDVAPDRKRGGDERRHRRRRPRSSPSRSMQREEQLRQTWAVSHNCAALTRSFSVSHGSDRVAPRLATELAPLWSRSVSPSRPQPMDSNSTGQNDRGVYVYVCVPG